MKGHNNSSLYKHFSLNFPFLWTHRQEHARARAPLMSHLFVYGETTTRNIRAASTFLNRATGMKSRGEDSGRVGVGFGFETLRGGGLCASESNHREIDFEPSFKCVALFVSFRVFQKGFSFASCGLRCEINMLFRNTYLLLSACWPLSVERRDRACVGFIRSVSCAV